MRSDNVKKGSERAPNRSLFYALGYTPEELDRPPDRRHLGLQRDRARPYEPGQDRRRGQGRGPDGGGHPHPDARHRGVRRHRHGPCGHEIQPAQPGTDLRQRRDHVPGPPAGRPGAGAQLRQDRARHGDGGLPAGRTRRGMFGRAHAGRHLWRRGSQPEQDVRGGRRLQGRDDHRRPAGGLHLQLLPQLRQLLGHVHRQQHELPVRGGGHRPCPATAPSPPSTPSGCSWPSTRAWP